MRATIRFWAALVGITLLPGCSSDSADDAEQSTGAAQPEQRRASWAVSPQDYTAVLSGGPFPAPMPMEFANQSIRQIMHLSVGGKSVRVRFSNLFGTAPLTLSGAHIARAGAGSAIDAASDTELKFAGQTSVTIPAGQEQWSDASTLTIDSAGNVAVTLFVSGSAPVATIHSVGSQTQFVTAGNALSAASFSDAETRTVYYWVTGIDVVAAGSGGVIVAFGDSITDGVGSTLDANHRYPNYLAERLRADASWAGYGVINEGISGNRVLNDIAGPMAVGRFARDVTEQSGASHVIMLIGINDLGFSGIVPAQAVTADQVTGGLQAMISQAQAKDLKVYLATLTPLLGTMAPYYSDQTESLRGTINTWIRDEADVDGVIDFDRAVQDPANALALNPAYDSGDHLHPSDAGYQVMANAIDLSLFR
ncbi:MAG: SGNH/GDSL hydrolase family protein [Deltaproteobacteria bacterium]